MEDRSSNLWVTVHGGGLNKFNRENDTFQRFSLPRDTSGYMENWMSQVFEDHRGTLWIWTDGGIVLFDPRSESFSGFDASFLQGGYIFGMTEDNLGHMLFATGIGLLRLTPSTGAVVRYDDAHGFHSPS
jgi:streptogramin lyase